MVEINLIKRLRVNNEMTQIQMAKACGVSQGTISQWEKGSSFPKADKVLTVAEVLGCASDDLLKLAEERRTRRSANGTIAKSSGHR